MFSQPSFGGYQASQKEQEEQQDNILLNALGLTAAGAGVTAGTGFAIDTERRRRSEGGPKTFKDAAKESASDLRSALGVLTGRSAFDTEIRAREPLGQTLNEINNIDDPKDKTNRENREYNRLRDFATKSNASDLAIDPNLFAEAPKDSSDRSRSDKSRYISNPFTQAAIAARDGFTVSAEDLLAAERDFRESQGRSAEGPRTTTAFSRIPIFDAARDVLSKTNLPGGYSPERMTARNARGVNLMTENLPQQIGSVLGRTGADFINNGARSLWWLVNAPQAVSDLVSEGLTGKANTPGLYGVDLKTYDDARNAGWLKEEKIIDSEGKEFTRFVPADEMITDKTRYKDSKDAYLQSEYQRLMNTVSPYEGKRRLTNDQQRIFGKRRVNNNLSTLLALPSAVAINAGLGLVNPLGGSDGYKAVLPSEDDPTVTRNAVAEVASKYILGRRGDILPWEEFKKVRPDVTKNEYMAYKAYKYNKGMDLNPLDGEWNLGGILKGTDDGIEGGEVMFLGKHMPTDTVLLPTAAAALGSAAGVALAKHGVLNPYGIQERIDRDTAKREVLKKRNKPEELEERLRLNAEIERLSDRKQFIDDSLRKIPGINKQNIDRMIYRRNPVLAGLLGGAAALGISSIAGHENERRRREQKIAENAQRNHFNGMDAGL